MVPSSHSVLSADECTLQHFKEGLEAPYHMKLTLVLKKQSHKYLLNFGQEIRLSFSFLVFCFFFFLYNEAQVTTGLHIRYQK